MYIATMEKHGRWDFLGISLSGWQQFPVLSISYSLTDQYRYQVTLECLDHSIPNYCWTICGYPYGIIVYPAKSTIC